MRHASAVNRTRHVGSITCTVSLGHYTINKPQLVENDSSSQVLLYKPEVNFYENSNYAFFVHNTIAVHIGRARATH